MERMNDDDSLDEMEKAAVTEIRDRIKIARTYKERPGGNNRPVLPREVRGRARDRHDTDAKLNADAIEKRMEKYGVDVTKMLERGRKREREDPRARRRNEHEANKDREMEDVSDEEMKDRRGLSKGAVKRAKKERDESVKRERSLARSHSRPREPSQVGLKDDAMAKVAKKVEKQGQNRWHGGSGEGDQRKAVHLVKWMNTGKKRNGTHYCR
jgi:nucleolar GTP-binding protein